MMSSAQSCLITSFFKSPPNGKETCQISTEKSNIDDATQDPVQSGHGFAEDCDSDSSNDDSSSGSDEEESERKPLVVNLCGLLSPAVMNRPSGRRMTAGLAREWSANRRVGSSLHKEEELQPKDRAATGADPYSSASNLNAGQESNLKSEDKVCSMDSSQGSSDTLVTKVTCTPLDAHLTSTVPKSSSQMKQCIFSWNSKSGTLDLSVPIEPPKASNLEELENSQEGTDLREEREEEGVRISEEGAAEDDIAAKVEGSAVVSTSKQGRKRKSSGSDDCEDGKCLQEEPRALTCLTRQTATGETIPEDVVAGSVEGWLGGDDSFEDFVESIRQKRRRQKRKRSKRKTPEEAEGDEIDGPSTIPSQPPIEGSSADSTSDGEPKPGKRPRRSAAVSANARISSSRRSRRSSVEEKKRTEISTVDCRQLSAEPGPLNVAGHSCVSLNSNLDGDLESVFHNRDVDLTPVCTTVDSDHENEPQVLELEDKECEADNSVIFVSSTPPTTSPIKHSSPLKPPDPIASATVTSAGLSAAWAKIFGRPNKAQTSEAVSTAKEGTVGSPAKGVKKRRTPSNSPRRHGSLSPSRSPRKGRSPRRGSPLRVRSPRKSSLSHSSPLREARCPHPASRQLAFSGSGGGGTCVVGSAPFEGVVHVQQIDPSCELWKLDAPKSLPFVRSLCRENTHPELQTPVAAGGLGLFATQASAGYSGSKIPSRIQLCSEEETDHILKRLEEAHPQKDVRGIFARYTRITTPPSTGGAGSQTSSERIPSSRPKKEKKLNTRRKNLSLKCSIRVRDGSRSTKDSKITVDTATYQKRGRRSLRLAKKTQGSISEDTADLGKSTQTGKIENDTQSNESRPAAITSAVTKPPAFVLDPWTEVYRPRGSSEVIGNGAQVEKLRVWLSAWKTRCCSQREAEQKPPMAAGNKERSDTTGSCKSSEKSVQESGVRCDSAVPWWVSEKDRDFLSISHLRRKRCRAPKCLDSSESGGETSEEEDDDSLCPVTLLCGPHGSGKSAAVYVCAQELGFKVFEVNSSGIRSRQTIMSTLREATLSHQVVMATHSKPAQVTGHVTRFFGGSKSHPSKETKVCKGSNLPSNSGGLYSFFKPKKETKIQRDGEPTSTSSRRDTSQMMRSDGASSRAELQTKKTKKQRKSQANSVIAIEDVSCPAPTEQTQSSNSVTLATATVILLDEVDILFDEDKGFWSAVYELIATTKRPIIMTCNDPRYDLDCDHQKLLFSRPTIPELSLHMQLLCLSHGAHMTSKAANQIAAFLNCDVRKVLNCLQFWLSLPGDNTVERQRLESTSNVGEVVSVGQPIQSCAGSPDSGRKEDLSLSLEHLLGLSASERQLLKRMQQLQSGSVDPVPLCGVLETLHRNGLEVAHPLDWLRSTQAQEHAVTCTCTSSHPTSTVGSPSASADIDTCSDLSRVRSSPTRTRPAEDSDTGSAQETKRSPTDEQFLSVPWRCRRNLKMASKNQCLDALSNFSDTLSDMDAVAVTSCDSHMTRIPAAWWKCELETGLLDELSLSGRGDCWRAEVTRTGEGIVGVAEGLALGACQRRMKETSSCGELYGLASQAKNQRRAEAVHSSHIKCSNVFATHWELSHIAMATDGLPVLQLICHSENLREAAHVKRRFRHHLQASTVDLCDLKALPRTAAFLSTSHPAEPT